MNVKPSHLVIAFSVFTISLLAGLGMINSFDQGYDNYIDNSQLHNFSNTFDKQTELQDSITELQSKINVENEDQSPFSQLFGFIDQLFSTGWAALKLFFTQLSFITDAISGLSSVFGVPEWFVTIASSLIIAFIAFAILTAIFQRDV